MRTKGERNAAGSPGSHRLETLNVGDRDTPPGIGTNKRRHAFFEINSLTVIGKTVVMYLVKRGVYLVWFGG